MKDNEKSLERRPEIIPGPLIKGPIKPVEGESFQGPLINMVGFGLERITRQRAEVPEHLKLPERPVYFLDPRTSRLVMISHREYEYEASWDYRAGLFAEIVELDENGKPQCRLSTSDVILTGENYQPVVVGPNEFGFPPSHIEVVEEEGGEGKEKFVPWNVWLGQLQFWMNEVNIGPNENLEAFLERFSEMRERSQAEAGRKIEEVFPESSQGMDELTAPINMIITDEGSDSPLFQASINAGLYPVLISPTEIIEVFKTRGEFKKAVSAYLGSQEYVPAVITQDLGATQRLVASKENIAEYHAIGYAIQQIQRRNPIFAFVLVSKEEPSDDPRVEKWVQKSGLPLVEEPKKICHGEYDCPYDEEMYRGLLMKLKADLLLTMFLRGGAPLIK
jgi:hypothetical protein